MNKLSCSIAALLVSTTALYAQAADLVFTNASVLTMNDDAPTAQAVAVTGNQISYVGDAAGAEALIGDNTEVLDLGGDTLLPGFVSGHDHIVASGWTSRGVSLFGIETLEEALAAIKEYADANPDEELILGYGFNQVAYGGWPTKEDLDSVVSDRPAFILDFTIHDVWMNSKAFEAGQVSPDEEDQVPGVMFWQRNAEGNQTGIGIEFQWAAAFRNAGAWDPAGEIPDIQKNLYDQAVKTGITAVHVPLMAMPTVTDLSLVKDDEKLALAHLHELEKNGELTIRTFVATGFKDPTATADEIVEHTLELREQYDSDMLRIWGIKIHPEGNWSSKTAWMLDDYADGSATRGAAAIEGPMITSVYLQANQNGLPVGTHVDGSQTVRNTVDAIMTARGAGYDVPNNLLHHYFWVSDQDHETVIENEIMVNTTPLFHVDWEAQDVNALDLLGRAKVEAIFARYSSLMALGHNVSISSDVPSAPIDLIGPLLNVEIAMTLQDPLNPDSKPFPLSRKPASLEESLKAVTIYPAAQQAMQDKIGSIEVGKYADLVVLDQDITAVEPREISNIKVLGTLMDGRFTHRDGI
ncbi:MULTISPECIES: amidohydrolase [unclassified Ruegeria]|uniref:amidohydrolase n=1 Tax=unclassified Ruegeria TaxID=2625375 RepID=UPI0014881BC3|nr:MULTISPECIES: amidohydrolase family protein [unclassified Ruegeria]NOE34891.1 amidohydrolase family protein [Ruegeria sp. HKCCD7318]